MKAQAAGGGTVEIWGGIECTVNRVGDRYCSQLDLTGHTARPDDLDRIAGLGIRLCARYLKVHCLVPSLMVRKIRKS